MTRQAEAIITQGSTILGGTQTAVLDPTYGGNLGYAPNIGEYVSNQQYVRDHTRVFLLEAPKGFDLLPDGPLWIRMLRAAIEQHPISVDGLNATLTTEFSAGTPVGGSGELQQDPINVTRAVSNVVFRIPEKTGMPFARLFSAWQRYFFMDENTKIPLISTLSNRPTDLLPDMISASMAFVETDATGLKVVKSWIGVNMMPHTSGDITGHRDLTAAKETPIYDIPFTSVMAVGDGVNAFCQKLIDNMSILGANPQLRQSFIDQISANVQAARTGYANNVQQTASDAIAV